MIPSSQFAFSCDADSSACFVAQEIGSHAAQDCHVMLRMTLADATLVFVKGDVENPVNRILDTRARSHGRFSFRAYVNDWPPKRTTAVKPIDCVLMHPRDRSV